ncbi:MAG TPA: hypothetical protein EYH22_00520 [Candidatus Nanopusillus sp.]|nr:hypothetical protein [Candidatus Nanopusillus sp.]
MLDLIVLIAISVLLMIVSSDILVKSIIEFSKKIDFPPYLITFFSISLGSSLPEILNAIIFSVNRHPQIGLFTILNNLVIDFTLVFGLSILLSRSLKDLYLNKQYVIAMILVYILFLFSVLDGYLSMTEGMMLFISYGITFTSFIIKNIDNLKVKKSLDIPLKDGLKYSFMIAASIFVLIVNANLIYVLSIILMKHFRIPYFIIGYILGFLTVMPEFLVTLISYFSLKREDIAIFNLFGSFITDLTFGIGISAAIIPFSIKMHIFLLYITMLVLYISMVLSDLVIIGKKIPKEVGLLLIGGYLIYSFIYLSW